MYFGPVETESRCMTNKGIFSLLEPLADIVRILGAHDCIQTGDLLKTQALLDQGYNFTVASLRYRRAPLSENSEIISQEAIEALQSVDAPFIFHHGDKPKIDLRYLHDAMLTGNLDNLRAKLHKMRSSFSWALQPITKAAIDVARSLDGGKEAMVLLHFKRAAARRQDQTLSNGTPDILAMAYHLGFVTEEERKNPQLFLQPSEAVFRAVLVGNSDTQ
ncbi:hypothetical protein BDV19DRAFT_365615 [Aspergillus venezuelensis]